MIQANSSKKMFGSASFGTLIAQALGSLSGSVTTSATAANLTTVGTADWIHWGATAVTSVNRKAGVTALLSNYTKIGAGTVARYTNDPRPLSWTGGTPTATSTNNLTGLYIPGVGSGFSFTAPADTTTRTLTVYVGGWNSTGTLVASLSDGSATNFTDVAPAATGQYDRNYVLTYSAASAGQTLTVRWTMSAGAGNVTLNGAALSGAGGTTVAVTGVSVSPTSASVAVNGTQQLTATVAPANATNQNVTWVSSLPGIATVSASGLVTGVAAGTAIITVTTQDGGFTATSSITVTVTTVAVTGVSVTPTASVAVGATAQLTGTVAPTNATNKTVTWASSLPGIATVNASGLVTGVAAGTAIITVTTQDGGFTATSTITVTAVTGGGGTLSGSGNSSAAAANLTTVGTADWIHWGATTVTSVNRKAGVTALLSNYTKIGAGTVARYTNDPRPLSWTGGTPTATGTNNLTGLYIPGVGSGFSFTAPADTTTRTLTVHVGGWNSTGRLEVSLSDNSAANFVDVAPAATGQYNRNYVLTYSAASAGQTLTVRWTVSAGAGNVTLNGAALSGTGGTTVAVTGVSVSPTSASVAVNGTQQLTATVAPANATNQNVTWVSSATAIATVSASGLVTGIAVGTATITVTTADGNKTATSTITVGTGGTATWTTLPYTAPILPMHASLLRTGKIFYFCGSGNEPARVSTPYKSVILDIGTGTFSDVTVAGQQPPNNLVPLDANGIPIDIFCAGHSFLADGRLVIASGTIQYDPFYGTRTAFLLDPITGQLIRVGDLNFGRWYPTLVTLGDGRVFAASGFDVTGSLVVQPEIYNSSTSTWTNFSTATSPFGLYAHLFLMDNGKLFYSGGNAFGDYGVTPRILTLPSQFNQTIVETPVPGLQTSASTNQAASVLLPPAQDQKVMIVGGGASMGAATKRVNIVDLKAANPAYVAAPSTTYARMHLSAVILPDRTVLVCNGSTMEEVTANSMLPSEIYNPATNTWTVSASQPVPRVYHSAALLLPDGRVLASGGNPNRGDDELRLEIYTPTYYSQSRPVITSAPQAVAYGGTITIQTSQAGSIKWVNLIRPMATTHSCDTEQRLVDVPFTTQTSSLTATVTTNRNLAPPGWYMLSIVNTSNVPSVATWIQLQ